MEFQVHSHRKHFGTTCHISMVTESSSHRDEGAEKKGLLPLSPLTCQWHAASNRDNSMMASVSV
jgi:hypothetical protein